MEPTNSITLIPTGSLIESKTNPRKVFNPSEEAEICGSVKAKGIIEPLDIRPHPSKKDYFEIVDGARRFRAAKAAELEEIPCLIRSYSDDEVVEIQLISFTQKVGLHPLDEANAYNELAKRKFNIEQIALKVGKGRSYIAKRLKLITLVEPAKEALAKEEINLPQALEIACLQPDQQKEALRTCLDKWNRMDLVGLKEFIRNNFILNLDGAAFKKDDVTLVPKAGACSVCPKMTGNNPDLFGDVRGKKCTDGKCFREKIKAHIARKLTEADINEEPLLLVSSSYSKAPKGVLNQNEYEIVKKSQAKKQGIFVDGNSIGQVVGIRLLKENDTEKPDAGGKATKKVPSMVHRQELYERRLEIFENRIEQETRLRIMKHLLARMKFPPSREDFILLVIELAGRNDIREEFWPMLGLKESQMEQLNDWLDMKNHIKNVKKFTDQQLVQIAFTTVLDHERIIEPTFPRADDDRLSDMLFRYKSVDRKKLHEEVAKEMEAKKPKPPKPIETPAKKKAKKKSSAKKPATPKAGKKAKKSKKKPK